MAQSGEKTQTMRALIALRERILGGAYAPGTRLMEVSLAEDLEISRTPVREAMARLVEEGLLERVRSGGYRVRSFGLSDVIDAIELRGVLEGTAARLAAERGVADGALDDMRARLADLDTCFGDDGQTVDFERYSELNGRFHAALWALPGSDTVEREVARAARLPFASPSAFLPDQSRIADFRRSLFAAQEQHAAVVDAIAAREGARAEAIMREHARGARRNLQYMWSGEAGARRPPNLSLIVPG